MASRAYFKGDFMGFTFGGKHSSNMGIVRTSDGSRYNSELLPSFNDVTVAVPGGDGTYYFGSYYQQKVFSVPFATDELTESEFRELRRWFGDKGIHQLIFDEAPYKAYSAKIAAVPNFNYICFDEVAPMERSVGVQRIYKGEGTIQFVCYYPFARSVNKYLSEYDGYDTFRYFLTSDTEKQDGKTYYIKNEDEEYVEFTGQVFVEGQKYYERKRVPFEWAAASGMKDLQGEYDSDGSSGQVTLYNPGDLEADIKLRIKIAATTNNFQRFIYLNGVEKLHFGPITAQGYDEQIEINSSTHLVEGYGPTSFVETTDTERVSGKFYYYIPENQSKKIRYDGNLENGVTYYEGRDYAFSGNLYNKFIDRGNFFKIPISTEQVPDFVISCKNQNSDKIAITNIEYDYLYY